jgi:hypothetical protein
MRRVSVMMGSASSLSNGLIWWMWVKLEEGRDPVGSINLHRNDRVPEMPHVVILIRT